MPRPKRKAPSNRFPWKPSLPKRPQLTLPIDENQIDKLIDYQRTVTGAGKKQAFNSCRAVNVSIIEDLNKEFSGQINAYPMVCHRYAGTGRSPGQLVEHFVGVIESDGGFFWFDGTADQIKKLEGLRINRVIRAVEDAADIPDSIRDTIGGKNWEPAYFSWIRSTES